MAYDQSQLEADIAALDGLPVYIAYNANVDAIVSVDEDLESFLERPPDPGETTPPTRLRTKQELATAITRTMATPGGDEVAMTDEFSATLEAELEPDSQQMGGQAGIMTNLLSSLGVSPITYTYLLSPTQQSMFDHPERVRYPRVDDGDLEFVSLADILNTDRTKINWVFEFSAGDELFGVRAKEGSRFIAASRPPEFDLFTGEFDTVIDQVGTVVDGALLAGYHNLTPDHVDAGYEETLRHARDVIRQLRSESEVDVHIEYAVTQDESLRRQMLELILPEANVIGIDTNELHMVQSDADLDIGDRTLSTDHGFDPDEILTHYRVLAALREQLGVECIRLHAMEYHLAVMDEYLHPDAVKRGLEFGAINAATKADRGRITAPSDLETGMTYEPSAKGREAIEVLADQLGAVTEDGALCTPTVVACPNRVVEDPAGTVGIGDIVSSSSFALELAVANGISDRDP
ncbi:ADP-dependent glucokinase/phosphofructokinase [Halobacteria archaeon AArc-curdl1]|uniref:ADP-dependent glucokinase/phosphofructokinase n=1 Tax=Natronosalvus hydrolyticus TaxID=2979988 RepID=A0AAP2ZA69_9EURY|nr:ADP-dependent glucokinase/phosphofructokinase [Halobacteria archaeon AArc-curdl1]